jgi:hypothetical protein
VGLFFVVFLPATTVANMTLGVLFPQEAAAPEWKLGWNPVLWLVMTAPWVTVAVVAVPVLHFVGAIAARRTSSRNARTVVVAVAPVLFLAVLVGLWGASYLTVELGAPVCFGAVVYGIVFRMPHVAGTT